MKSKELSLFYVVPLLAEHIYGGTLLTMCPNDFICFYDWAEGRLIRRIDVNVK
uniref:Uncharacterized protein n=1 Tax=Cucumis melo TaxID=3656 RepID=A0A9I9CCK2_CUCME